MSTVSAVARGLRDASQKAAAAASATNDVASVYPRLLAAAGSFVTGREAREDLVQESIARCWDVVESLKMPSNRAVAYLRGAIRLIAFEQRRARRDEVSISSLDFADPDGEVLDHMIHDEDIKRVREAFALLPAAYRRTLEESLIQGYTCEEIAQRESVSAATIRQRKHRACQTLRRAYLAAKN